MKKLQNYNLFISENWNPGDKWGNLLTKHTELSDEKTISHFIEYNSLPSIILEIWRKIRDDYNKYPQKMTTRGMVYSVRNNNKLEFEFTPQGEINLWRARSEASKSSPDSPIKIDWKLVKSAKFSWLELKNMID